MFLKFPLCAVMVPPLVLVLCRWVLCDEIFWSHMRLPSKCEDCTCMGLVFCVWGGWRGGVWVTDAVRLYRTRCAIPSHPSASPPGSRGASQRSVRQDLWGKFSPNPLLHFLTEENNRAELANKMGTLMYAPDSLPLLRCSAVGLKLNSHLTWFTTLGAILNLANFTEYSKTPSENISRVGPRMLNIESEFYQSD